MIHDQWIQSNFGMDLLLLSRLGTLFGVRYRSWLALRVFLGDRNGQEKEGKGMNRSGLSKWCISLLPQRRMKVSAQSRFLEERFAVNVYLYFIVVSLFPARPFLRGWLFNFVPLGRPHFYLPVSPESGLSRSFGSILQSIFATHICLFALEEFWIRIGEPIWYLTVLRFLGVLVAVPISSGQNPQCAYSTL